MIDDKAAVKDLNDAACLDPGAAETLAAPGRQSQ